MPHHPHLEYSYLNGLLISLLTGLISNDSCMGKYQIPLGGLYYKLEKNETILIFL